MGRRQGFLSMGIAGRQVWVLSQLPLKDQSKSGDCAGCIGLLLDSSTRLLTIHSLQKS
jgi:hypothetical protein